nr:pre-mRNA-splicing regulator WTAP-like [Ciona intestinalis]|eukprot:XP_002128763.1 pre-mRNA-splicing regulator WTAP-like [Ciona intestinalis]
MGDNSPPAKRSRKSSVDLTDLSKDDLIKKYQKQQQYVEHLESKLGNTGEDEKEKSQATESSRRENVLVMRLANKEQEIQDLAAQMNHIKKAQEDTALMSLRQASLDPGVNLLFGRMREELQQTKDKLEQANSDLSAWKFTPDSQTGKKLMSRCRTLLAENKDLGLQISQGKISQLEAELALQKKYSEELKSSQDELNEFVIQLDEEVEGMQGTIKVLQQQLSSAKQDVEKYKNLIEKLNTNAGNNGVNCSLNSPLKNHTEMSENGVTKSQNDAQCDDTDSRVEIDRTSCANTIQNIAGSSELSENQDEEVASPQRSPGTPLEEVQPVTPNSGSDMPKSPGTPLYETMDYTEDGANQQQLSVNAWEDRTSVSAPINHDSHAVDDDPDIKAHISAVTPQEGGLNGPNKTEESAKVVYEVNDNRTPNHTSVTEVKTDNFNHKPLDDKEDIKNSTEETNTAQADTPPQKKEVKTPHETTTPEMPQQMIQEPALLAYFKNLMSQPYVMPDGKTILPNPMIPGAMVPGLTLMPQAGDSNGAVIANPAAYPLTPEYIAQQNAFMAMSQLMMLRGGIPQGDPKIVDPALQARMMGVLPQNGVLEESKPAE